VPEPQLRGLSDLGAMLKSLNPELLAGEFVFASLPGASFADAAYLSPIGSFQEAEGLSVIVSKATAVRHGIGFALTLRCITLHVHSDLAAVGLTAAIATRLAEEGVSANVIAGFFHDHVFVPAEQADRALEALVSLQGSPGSC
jgi:hypothetical protein